MKLHRAFGLRLLSIVALICAISSSGSAQMINREQFRFPQDDNRGLQLIASDIPADTNSWLVRARVSRTGGRPTPWLYKDLMTRVASVISERLCVAFLKGGLPGVVVTVACKLTLPMVTQIILNDYLNEGICGVTMDIKEWERPGYSGVPREWAVAIPVGPREDVSFALAKAIATGRSPVDAVVPTTGPWHWTTIQNYGTFDHMSAHTSGCEDAKLNLEFETVTVCDAILSIYSGKSVCRSESGKLWTHRYPEHRSLSSHWEKQLIKGDSCTTIEGVNQFGFDNILTRTYISPTRFHYSHTCNGETIEAARCRALP